MATNDPFGWLGATADGKYQIEEVVGEGGFAVVYRAKHLGFGETVAFKCLRVPAELVGNERERFFESFMHEGKLQHRLSRMTAGIVQALDVGATTSPNGTWTPYLVLEWLEGKSLERDMDERHQLGMRGRPVHEAMALLDPVARALELAHEQNVAHRDVKPANLYLAEIGGRPTIKVLDFGIAKVITENVSVTRAFESTGRALQAFTAHYGAPEQFARRFGATGPWTDVFAFALVFVELVSGKRALEGDDAAELFVSAADGDHRPTLRARGVECSDEIEEVLKVALAVEPRARFRTMGEFWDALCEATDFVPRQPFSSAHAVVASLPEPKPESKPASDAGARPEAEARDKPPEASTQLSSSSQVPLVPKAVKPAIMPRRSASPLGVAGVAIASLAIGVGGLMYLLKPRPEGLRPPGSASESAQASGSETPSAARNEQPSGQRSEQVERAEIPSASAAGPAGSSGPEVASAGPPGALRASGPPRVVPQGTVPGSALWVEEFRLQSLPDDGGRNLLDAQVKCAEAGLSLCSEAQWLRACAENSNLGREASWTLTGHSNGFVVRGGGSCQIRAVVPGSSATPDRRGFCCERSVAVQSTNSNKDFLVATAGKLEEVEAALNSRKSSRMVGLMGEGVNIDGDAKTLAQVTKLFDDSYQQYPDQWSVIDNCEVAMQTIVRRVPVVTKSKRGTKKRIRRLESSSWSAECDVLQQRGGEVSLVTLGYVFGGSGKIQSIDEEHRTREWSKP